MTLLQTLALAYFVTWVAYLPRAYDADRLFDTPQRTRTRAVLDAMWISACWPLTVIVEGVSLIIGRRR